MGRLSAEKNPHICFDQSTLAGLLVKWHVGLRHASPNMSLQMEKRCSSALPFISLTYIKVAHTEQSFLKYYMEGIGNDTTINAVKKHILATTNIVESNGGLIIRGRTCGI